MADTGLRRREPALLRFLGAVERAGNKLPDAFWLFWILSGVLLVVSALASGATAQAPGQDKTIVVRSLLSGEGLRTMVGDAVENFVSFPPLGLILVVMLGVALATETGLLHALLRASIVKVPAGWLTFALAFTGMTAHVLGDSAYVVLVPLGGVVFAVRGRNPLLGVVVAFVSLSAGYDASPLVTPTDTLLAGLTTSAAHLIDPSYTVSPLANYFFALASSVVLAGVITLVTEKVLVRRADAIGIDADAAEGPPPPTRAGTCGWARPSGRACGGPASRRGWSCSPAWWRWSRRARRCAARTGASSTPRCSRTSPSSSSCCSSWPGSPTASRSARCAAPATCRA
nr:hypothetical protein GCM10020241_58630 [Streptoalloteichus tenebrarius]